MENTDRENELKKLAVAFYSVPKGTAKELADAAGISKATFYRIYGSREQLGGLLTEKANGVVRMLLEEMEKNVSDYEAALRRLIELHCREKEYLMYLCYGAVTGTCDTVCQETYREAVSRFFLRGQKAGAFRIDLPADVMTEVFLGTMGSLFDAENHGRIASAALAATFEKFLLNGISNS